MTSNRKIGNPSAFFEDYKNPYPANSSLAKVNTHITLDPALIAELAAAAQAPEKTPPSVSLEDYNELVQSIKTARGKNHEEITGLRILSGDFDWEAFGNAPTPKNPSRRNSFSE